MSYWKNRMHCEVDQSLKDRAARLEQTILGLPPADLKEAIKQHVDCSLSVEGVFNSPNHSQSLSDGLEWGVEAYLGDVSKDLVFEVRKRVVSTEAQVDIGYRLHEIKVGRNFSGERFEKVPSKMRELFEFINSPEVKALGSIIRAALFRFYFVSIHPFADGNGRTARVIEASILCDSQAPKIACLALPKLYANNEPTYYKQLSDARFKGGGALSGWIKYILDYLEEEIW